MRLTLMQLPLRLWWAALSLLPFVPQAAADELQAFPPAGPGMERHVVWLPVLDNEAMARVELIVGRTVVTDDINRYFFAGRIEAETLAGWGYTRYVVNTLGPMAGTLMAVLPDAPQVQRFIALGGEPFLVRYNSRLPIVVYVPEWVEVRYRVWRAGAEQLPLPPG